MYRGYIVENLDIVGPLFTIIAGKDRYEVSNLRTYECTKISEDPRNNHYEIRRRFDSENMPISEGDIINIRSEIDMEGGWRTFFLSFYIFVGARSVVDDL